MQRKEYADVGTHEHWLLAVARQFVVALGAARCVVCRGDVSSSNVKSGGRQVPITYTREMAWATELLRLLPTIGLIGLYIWFTRRQLGGGFGGGGGMGGRGIFNVGKAQVCTCAL